MVFFEQIGKKINNISCNVVQHTKDFAETTRLNTYISDEEKNITNLYTAFGKEYYEKHKDNPNEEEKEFFVQITAAYKAIELYKEQLEHIKSEQDRIVQMRAAEQAMAKAAAIEHAAEIAKAKAQAKEQAAEQAKAKAQAKEQEAAEAKSRAEELSMPITASISDNLSSNITTSRKDTFLYSFIEEDTPEDNIIINSSFSNSDIDSTHEDNVIDDSSSNDSDVDISNEGNSSENLIVENFFNDDSDIDSTSEDNVIDDSPSNDSDVDIPNEGNSSENLIVEHFFNDDSDIDSTSEDNVIDDFSSNDSDIDFTHEDNVTENSSLNDSDEDIPSENNITVDSSNDDSDKDASSDNLEDQYDINSLYISAKNNQFYNKDKDTESIDNPKIEKNSFNSNFLFNENTNSFFTEEFFSDGSYLKDTPPIRDNTQKEHTINNLYSGMITVEDINM